MISRAASLPRVCLKCRTVFAPRRAANFAQRRLLVSSAVKREATAWGKAVESKDIIEPINSEPVRVHTTSNLQETGERQGTQTDLPTEPGSAPENDSVNHSSNQSRPTDLDQISSTIRASADDTEQEKALAKDDVKEEELQEPARDDLLDHHQLNVGALGKPLEALIIKNPNQMKTPKASMPVIEVEAPPEEVNVEWEDLVPKDEVATSENSEEVRQNIDELRPRDTRVLLTGHFDKLLGQLVDGFTRGQLVDYHKHFQREETSSGAEDTSMYSWIKKQTSWTPSVPIDVHALKPKQMLALAIMRETWGVETHDRAEGIGEKKIWLPTSAFKAMFREFTDIPVL